MRDNVNDEVKKLSSYGDVLRQEDGNSNVYTMTYDGAGRVIQRVGPEGTTSYSYVAGGTGGANQVSGITSFGGISETYTYDTYGDKIGLSEVINGNTYATTYSYNPTYGNLSYVIYPSGVQLNYSFDANGYLSNITDATTNNSLYTVNAMNSYGQATSYTSGNGQTSTLTTNFGVPTRYYTPGGSIQNLTLTYDWTTGDLTNRYDGIYGNSETFTYDNNDRLISSQVNGGTVVNYTFGNNGNITHKPDVGDYFYDDTKINAVGQVSNDENNISNNTQNITYVGFNKAATITENGYELDYTYGPDFSRKYSKLYRQAHPTDSILNTRVYSGNYEVNDDQSGNPQQIHYVYANNGLVAIIVKDNSGVNDYFTYTDQLGSILTVTDNTGSVFPRQSFDAWGRYRNPTNWSYSSIPTLYSWLYRGYTGHEMLNTFKLINMNGRMYDPLLGRMLSPDNNIQDPNSTQAYNRYSYVTNNPLRYSDPSGWFEFPVQTGHPVTGGGGGSTGNVADNGGLTPDGIMGTGNNYNSDQSYSNDGNASGAGGQTNNPDGALGTISDITGSHYTSPLVQDLVQFLEGQIEAITTQNGDCSDVEPDDQAAAITQACNDAIQAAHDLVNNAPQLPQFQGVGDPSAFDALGSITTLAGIYTGLIGALASDPVIVAGAASAGMWAGGVGFGISATSMAISIFNGEMPSYGDVGDLVVNTGSLFLSGTPGAVAGAALSIAEYGSFLSTGNSIGKNAQMIYNNEQYWNNP